VRRCYPFVGLGLLFGQCAGQPVPLPLPLPIWDAVSTPWAHRHANMPHPNTLCRLLAHATSLSLCGGSFASAALCQGRAAYQHLISHKPELSDSLSERAATLPARSRTHPSSFRQSSHLILGSWGVLETVGVISVPTCRPYKNHMASIKGAYRAGAPRESASSARRVFFLLAFRPADSFYKFLARPKSEVPLPPPSFPPSAE
jgi:hypothetical protein